MIVTVLCTKPKAWWKILSPVIRFVERVPFSHVSFQYRNEVHESTIPKSRSIDLEVFERENIIVEKFTVALPIEENDLMAFIQLTDKIPYSILQLVLILFKILGLKALRKAKLNDQRASICTERVARLLRFAGLWNFKGSFDSISLIQVYKALYRLEKSTYTDKKGTAA